MTIMMVTRLTIILYISCKVCSNKLFHITAAATNHLDSLCFKDILGPWPILPASITATPI